MSWQSWIKNSYKAEVYRLQGKISALENREDVPLKVKQELIGRYKQAINLFLDAKAEIK